jgi:hypothetical protein
MRGGDELMGSLFSYVDLETRVRQSHSLRAIRAIVNEALAALPQWPGGRRLPDGHAERIAALHMIEPRSDRPNTITVGADKAYDAEDFGNELCAMKVTPHVTRNTGGRSSAIGGRTTRHRGYVISQRIRKRIEEAFGWMKTIALQEKTKFRGRERVVGLHLRRLRLQSDAAAQLMAGQL